MKNNSKHIEDLVKNSLDGYKDELSDKVWKNLDKKLSYMNFLKFSLTNFNIYYLSSLIVLGVSSIVIISNNNDSTLNTKPSIINTKIDSSATKENEAININETHKVQKANNSEIKTTSTNTDEVKSNKESTNKPVSEKQEKEAINTPINNTIASPSQEANIENDVAKAKKVIKKVSIQKKVKIQSTITQIDSVEIKDNKKR